MRLGEHKLSVTTEGGLDEKLISVTKYINHESFTMPNNDIVVIELAEEVDLNTYTPACMAKTSDTTAFDGKTALVYGKIIPVAVTSLNCSQVGEPCPMGQATTLTS